MTSKYSSYSLSINKYVLGVWSINFKIFLFLICFEVIRLKTFGLVERIFHILVELFSEIISIVNSENSLIEIDIGGEIEILT
jgi:hypothetical protein